MRASIALAVSLVACGDGGPPPVGSDHRTYVVSRYRLAETFTESRQLGLDLDGLDGDSTPIDNQLGAAFAALMSQAGGFFTPQATTDRLVARGEVLQLVDVHAPLPDETAIATVALHVGTSPEPAPCASDDDPICGRHLLGDAVIAIEPTSTGTALPSRQRDGRYESARGPLVLVTGVFGVPIHLDLFGARIVYDDVPAGDSLSGVIGGGVSLAQLHERVFPQVPPIMNAAIARDCMRPDQTTRCGCIPGSAGGDFVRFIDTGHPDCTVSLDEVHASHLVRSQVDPDLLLDGEHLLSFGVGFEAVPATIR